MTERQPYDPEFTAWMAAGQPEETLSKWAEQARQLTEEDDEDV